MQYVHVPTNNNMCTLIIIITVFSFFSFQLTVVFFLLRSLVCTLVLHSDLNGFIFMCKYMFVYATNERKIKLKRLHIFKMTVSTSRRAHMTISTRSVYGYLIRRNKNRNDTKIERAHTHGE